MKKVLIISHVFPPGNTVGAIRVGKFAKYLPAFGWQPIVLTADSSKTLPQTLPVEVDSSCIIMKPSFSIASILANQVSRAKRNNAEIATTKIVQNNNITRTWFSNYLRLAKPFYSLPVINRLLFEPIGWKRHAVKAGLKIIHEKKVDIIFSSLNPSVSHSVAAKLSTKLKVPWVAEFRDPWSLTEYRSKMQPFHFLEERWEKITMQKASLLITVSEIWACKLEKFHSKRTIVIPNGFDEEDYQNETPLAQKFTLTYTGNIYPGKRDPTPLFKAIASLKKEGKITPNKFEVRFFGQNVTEHVKPLIEKFSIREFVNVNDFVPYTESIKHQKESAALLLLSWNNLKDDGTLTAKVFEYMGARRPILALALKCGAIDYLLQKTGTGVIANDPEEIKIIIVKWLEEYTRNRDIQLHYCPNKEVILKYTRREQAKKLSEILDSVIRQHHVQ